MNLIEAAADMVGAALLCGGCALVFLAENPEMLARFNAWVAEHGQDAALTVHEAHSLAHTLWRAEQAVPR